MNLYFDHRAYDSVHVYFYLDQKYYGTIYAEKNEITFVEIPDDAKHVKISFSTIFDSSEELVKYKVKDADRVFGPKRNPLKTGVEKQSWQFPYDLEFNVENGKGDMSFVPTAFKNRNLEGAHYYEGRYLENGNFIEMKLMKRAVSFGIEEFRKKNLLIWGAILVAGIITLPIQFILYQYNGMSAGWYKAHGSGILLAILAISLGTIMFTSYWKYKSMYREKTMKPTLTFTEEGDFVEVE